jgi:hypothetical protein
MTLKKTKTKFTIFVCFGDLAGYDEGSRSDSFWDERKYEQLNENSSKLYGSYFCKVIGKGDFGEAKRWDEEEYLKGDFGEVWEEFFFSSNLGWMGN